MAGESRDLLHGGVFPDKDLILDLLVLAEAMSAAQFVHVCAEG